MRPLPLEIPTQDIAIADRTFRLKEMSAGDRRVYAAQIETMLTAVNAVSNGSGDVADAQVKAHTALRTALAMDGDGQPADIPDEWLNTHVLAQPSVFDAILEEQRKLNDAGNGLGNVVSLLLAP